MCYHCMEVWLKGERTTDEVLRMAMRKAGVLSGVCMICSYPFYLYI